MTNQVDTRPLTPASNPAPAAAAPTLMDHVDRALEWLWHLLSSMRLAMVIMLVIAVLAIPGTIFRQIPSEIALANGITVDWLTGSDLTESVWDTFFDFYMETKNVCVAHGTHRVPSLGK